MSESTGTETAGYRVYEPDRDDADAFPIEMDDGVQIDLVEQTGLENMRARLWYLEPGDSVSFHYHEEQEELFYVVDGTGHMLVGEDQDLVEIPEGGMIRPETSTPRQLRNESDDEVTWLAIGAPPVVEAQLWNEYDHDGTPSEAGEYRDLSEWL